MHFQLTPSYSANNPWKRSVLLLSLSWGYRCDLRERYGYNRGRQYLTYFVLPACSGLILNVPFSSCNRMLLYLSNFKTQWVWIWQQLGHVGHHPFHSHFMSHGYNPDSTRPQEHHRSLSKSSSSLLQKACTALLICQSALRFFSWCFPEVPSNPVLYSQCLQPQRIYWVTHLKWQSSWYSSRAWICYRADVGHTQS